MDTPQERPRFEMHCARIIEAMGGASREDGTVPPENPVDYELLWECLFNMRDEVLSQRSYSRT